jgi:threonine dehydrogenase-like Zn-dependent dehydrogenase
MKAAVFTGNRHVSLEEFPDPTPADGDVILEIKASGMCGSMPIEQRQMRSIDARA